MGTDASAILDDGLVAVVRTDSADRAVALAERLAGAGVGTIEVAFTVPGAAAAVRRLRDRLPDPVRLGAGTILTADDAVEATAAGAEFLFGPTFDPEVAAAARRLGVPYIPGVFTPTEARRCLAEGLSVLKLFPAGVYGPAGLRALREPLPQAAWVPTGGVGVADVAAWLDSGAAAVGLGAALTRAPDPAAAAAAALDAIRSARAGAV
jgi:2-dehydro-3-deoxyphosphogluconate aldolase/(4S)-4-hydroxy-2-oxoglutarate aldolase